ncbi:hypothetical protein C8R45DRAFT_1101243 [Mycena sanguinolenta]|nr:hypothetical protein C8R45DRAFT_1101243 [Mycena sanguinolenta]
MPKSQFSGPQNAYIESFFDEFAEELNKGAGGGELTKWKQSKASAILDTALFSDLDMVKNPRKTWFEIVRKFTNYRNQVYPKLATAGNAPALTNLKANPLLKFASIMSGRQLFADENSELLKVASHQRMADTKNKSPGAVYQNVLKEHWDALTPEEQAVWNDRAEKDATNVAENQQGFVRTMSLALQDLCQGGLLGDTELVVWYGYREVGTDDIVADREVSLVIHEHCVHNQVNFGVGQEDFCAEYKKAWWNFVDRSIPRPIRVNPLIPRNSDGPPVFPAIDANKIAIDDARTLLGDYFDQCWASRLVDSNTTQIPWQDIISNPKRYYDSTLFSIPLDHPQNLSGIQVLTLIQELIATSGIKSASPFSFLDRERSSGPASGPTSAMPPHKAEDSPTPRESSPVSSELKSLPTSPSPGPKSPTPSADQISLSQHPIPPSALSLSPPPSPEPPKTRQDRKRKVKPSRDTEQTGSEVEEKAAKKRKRNAQKQKESDDAPAPRRSSRRNPSSKPTAASTSKRTGKPVKSR